MTAAAALMLLLDQVDYTSGSCHVAESVGGALPREIIELCRAVLRTEKEREECRRQLFTRAKQAIYNGFEPDNQAALYYDIEQELER